MKNKRLSLRAATEPMLDKMFDRSIKAQGIVYVQAPQNSNRKNSIIQLKPDDKLLFHCYKRYKTFSYNFDHVYQDSDKNYSLLYDKAFQKSNSLNAIRLDVNYMLYCTGLVTTSRQLLLTQNLFNDQLVTIFQNLIRDGSYTWAMSALTVTEENIYDIIGNLKSLQIRELLNNKFPNASDFHLVEISQTSPETAFQLIQFIKESQSKKQKYFNKSHFIIYCQVTPKSRKDKKRKLLFVDCTKNSDVDDRNWDNGSSLVLNKCLLGILNKMENNKESYAPFRDSKMTRILKPFLTSDAKVDAVGIISSEDQETPFSTLNLIKNLSKLKIPIYKVSQQLKQSRINPEKMQGEQKSYQLRDSQRGNQKIVEQIYSSKEKTARKSIPTQISQIVVPKSDVLQQIRKNAKNELESNKKINKLRAQIKLMKKKQQLSLSNVMFEDKSFDESLQNQQLEHAVKKQAELVYQSEKINKQRLQQINKSISKVEKLKMFREYYTIALNSQKQELEEFKKNQQVLYQFYEQRLQKIDKDLKKSPKQLLGLEVADKKSSKSSSKRYQSNEKQSLPSIQQKANKRVAYVKEKVKKGRVEYQDFLSKNVSQYQSYLSAYTDQ